MTGRLSSEREVGEGITAVPRKELDKELATSTSKEIRI